MLECETRQLLQKRSFAGPGFDRYGDPYDCIAALPAGRIAAAKFGGIDVIAFDMAGPELASAGVACEPACAVKTALWEVFDADARCASCLGDAGPWYGTHKS